jgi:hypothetical protein
MRGITLVAVLTETARLSRAQLPMERCLLRPMIPTLQDLDGENIWKWPLFAFAIP